MAISYVLNPFTGNFDAIDTSSALTEPPKNFLLNSDFSVTERPSRFANLGETKYGIDRWYTYNQIGPSAIVSIGPTSALLPASVNALSVVVSTPPGAASGTGVEVYQTLENKDTKQLYNQTASFSIQVLALGNVTQVGVQFMYNGTESRVQSAIGTEQLFTVNSSTCTLCTISGQALGTAMTTSGVVGVRIRPTAVSSGDLSDSGNGVAIEQAMLNLGATPAPWHRQYSSYGGELIACQRFYELLSTSGTGSGAFSVSGYGQGGPPSSQGWIPYKTKKRTSNSPEVQGLWSVSNCFQPTVRGYSEYGFSIEVIVIALGTYSYGPNSGDDIITIDAEIY